MHRPALLRASLASLLAVLAPAVSAQDPGQQRPGQPQPGTGTKPVAEAKPAEERALPIDAAAEKRGSPVRELTLGEAMRLGRMHNVGLRAAEVVPQQARLDLLFAEAGFEPELYGYTGYGESQANARNEFSPAVNSTTIDAQLGWRQRVVTGGLIDLAFQPTRFESSESGGLFPDRQFQSEWSASYRQPLLRSAWTDYGLAQVNTARFRQSQAEHDYERAVQDTLLAIVVAYWELSFSRENWRVVAAALDVALEQLRITDERIRVQALAPRDRIADEAEIARRREELIFADNAIAAREDELRRLLYDGQDRLLWQINLRPTSPIEPAARAGELEFEALAEIAMSHRPDIRALRASVAAAEITLLETERDTLPSLDLVSSYGSDGVRDQFHDSFRDAIDQQSPDWSVRLEFAVSIGNNAARSRAQKARLEVERQRRVLHATSLDVAKEVRDAVRNLGSLAQSQLASAESVRLANTNLETEQVKLQIGSSTAFEVQRRNQELREAKSRHLRNQLEYRIAESRLLFAQGLLQANVE